MFPRGLIVSIQPRQDSAFDYDEVPLFARDCAENVVAFRVAGRDILDVKDVAPNIPIIGLEKLAHPDQPYITPTFIEASGLARIGADYVAMECSERTDFAEIDKAVQAGIKVIADVADVEHAILAEGLGCIAITTALYGYVGGKRDLPGQRFVGDCVKRVKIPVIAEGGYFSPYDVMCANKFGAHSVCIGSAIHDPRSISKRFAEAFNGR